MTGLPKYKRADDPPNENIPHRVRLAVRRYPVQVALVLALIVVAYPVYLMLGVVSDVRHATDKLRDSQHQLRDSQDQLRAAHNALRGTQRQLQDSRVAITSRLCTVINQNGKSNNRQNSYIRALIVGGAKQGAVFEPLYKQYGGPPYDVRLRKAKKVASRLGRYEVTHLNCDQIVDEINADSTSSP